MLYRQKAELYVGLQLVRQYMRLVVLVAGREAAVPEEPAALGTWQPSFLSSILSRPAHTTHPPH